MGSHSITCHPAEVTFPPKELGSVAWAWAPGAIY